MEGYVEREAFVEEYTDPNLEGYWVTLPAQHGYPEDKGYVSLAAAEEFGLDEGDTFRCLFDAENQDVIIMSGPIGKNIYEED